MDIITFCSFKGGTAKTSCALHIAYCLATFHQKRVLLVDFDSQANLSIGMGLGPDQELTMANVLLEEKGIDEVIQKECMKNLSIIPANAYLDGIERNALLASDPYAHERLRRALVPLDYDFVFIDTPPSLGWLTQSAFFASTGSLICAIPEAYSVIALRRLKEFHESINRYHEIQLLGIIFSFWNDRGAVNESFLLEIASCFPEKLFEAKIRRDITVSRAVLKGKPVHELNEKARASLDYRKVTEEFLEKVQMGVGV
ncbi:MAG: ParA family protein [Simkaniaceae bacterium]